MTHISVFAAGNLDLAFYAFSLLAGLLGNSLLSSMQRRGFRPGGFRSFRRRRRPGIFGGLFLFLFLGPIIVIVLIAYALFALFSGFQRRR